MSKHLPNAVPIDHTICLAYLAHERFDSFGVNTKVDDGQVLGYGWAGLLRKYVVEPAHMWWPNTLVQISLFRYAAISLSFS